LPDKKNDRLKIESIIEEDKKKIVEIFSYGSIFTLLPLAIEIPEWLNDSFKFPNWIFYIVAIFVVVFVGIMLVRFVRHYFLWALVLTLMVMGIMWFLDIPLALFVESININDNPEMFRKLYATSVTGTAAGVRFICDKMLKGITAKLISKGR